MRLPADHPGHAHADPVDEGGSTFGGLPSEFRAGITDIVVASAEYLTALILAAVPQPSSPDAIQPAATPGVAHSDDFRSVNWFGATYEFTPNQAACVKVLWEHWKRGTPVVGDESLLQAVDPEAPPRKLGDVFRSSMAWGTMIVAGDNKGTHRLSG
jgi:hypothetical protein